MQLLLNEVLQKVSNAKTKAQKIKLLQQYNTPALRQILIANFDESVISMLPDGEVPYKENCLLYTSPSPRDMRRSRMPSSA